MHFGFSYVGLIFLLMLFIPNGFWAKNLPKDYEKYVQNENKILLLLERIGEVLVTTILVIFSDFNIRDAGWWLAWLIGAFVLMILYEVFWVRYFRSEKRMRDFYSSILGIPVAGATLPVMAVMMRAIYGGNILLLVADVILGIGHIGIHLGHRRECKASSVVVK